MQILLVRVLYVLVGVLVGVLGVTGVLVLMQDDRAAIAPQGLSSAQQRDDETSSDVVQEMDLVHQVNPALIPDDIDDLVFPKLAFDRKSAIYAWVSAISDEQVLNWLEQSVGSTWDESVRNQSELQSALLQKLSTTAPARAFEFAWAQDDSQVYALTSIVLHAWASLDWDGATAQLKKLGVGEGQLFLPSIFNAQEDLSLDSLRAIAKELGDESYALTHYFQNLTHRRIEDPETTWYEIVELATAEGVEDATGHALGGIAVAWVEKDGSQVYDRILASIAGDSNFDHALPQIVGVLAEEQPAVVFDYLMANLGETALSVIERSGMSYRWARRDPKGALTRADSLPASRFRNTLISSAIYHWAENNPRELLESTELLPEGDQEEGWRSAIRSLTRKSPAQATAYVLQIEDFDTQKLVAESMVREWSYRDAKAMQDWVLNLPDSNPLRAALLRPLAWSLVDTDPRTAFHLALGQPIEERESSELPAVAYEVSVIGSIAFRDLDLALELLPQVRDVGSSKAQAYSSIGTQLITNGKIDRAISLGGELSNDGQDMYFMSVASAWAIQDPKGVLSQMDKFPTAKIKSSIALSLNVINEMMNSYSTEEMSDLKQYLSDEDQEKLQQIQEIDMLNPTPEEVEKLNELFPGAW